MKSHKPSMEIKRKVPNEYVVPVMTYGSETWALTTVQMEAFIVAQRTMARIMQGASLPDRKRNTWFRQQTGVAVFTDAVKKSKHR